MTLSVFDNELRSRNVTPHTFETPCQSDHLPDLLPVDLFLKFMLIRFDDEGFPVDGKNVDHRAPGQPGKFTPDFVGNGDLASLPNRGGVCHVFRLSEILKSVKYKLGSKVKIVSDMIVTHYVRENLEISDAGCGN